MLELRIAKPCDQTWTAMRGDDTVRHCVRCEKNVYNIAWMTEAEVEELIRRTEGHFCARLYRRTDNRVMTKDCPKGVAAVRRKRTLALAAAGASMVFGFSLLRPATAGAVSVPRHRKPESLPAEPKNSEFTLGAVDYPSIEKHQPSQISNGKPSETDRSLMELHVSRIPLEVRRNDIERFGY